jgi:hypothetical protein
VANTLAYYDTATITAVKSFIVQAPGNKLYHHFLNFIEFRRNSETNLDLGVGLQKEERN